MNPRPESPPNPESREQSPLRFALIIVALVAIVTLALGLFFVRNPIAIGTWIARSGLERAGLESALAQGPLGPQTYFHGGTGRQTLVLVHGMGHQAGSWLKVVADLGEDYRLIVPDLVGHGESAPDEGPLGIDDALWGLASVIDAASPDAPVILVGNSMGGWVSAHYALARPERVERLVLVNSSGIAGQLGGGSLDGTDLEGLTLVPENREQAAVLVKALGPANAPPPAGFVLDDMVRRIARGPSPRVMAGLSPDAFLDFRLHLIEVPVDIVWGLEDRLLTADYGRRLEAGIGEARFHGLEACGHIPQQQCPGLFVRTLLDALAEPFEATETMGGEGEVVEGSDGEGPEGEAISPESATAAATQAAPDTPSGQ